MPLPEDNAYGGPKELPFEVELEAAILMEASTGKVLYDKNAYERYEPASVTKIMKLLLALEAINEGKIRWDEHLVVSNKAGRMPGSRMGLKTGQVVSIVSQVKVPNGKDTKVDLVLAENLGAVVPANQDYDLKTEIMNRKSFSPYY